MGQQNSRTGLSIKSRGFGLNIVSNFLILSTTNLNNP